MANDITGFGTVVNVIASNSYPLGIAVTQFSDDTDPVDMASIRIADTAMGVNGDLIKWARAATNPVVLNVIPGSQNDIDLATLANNNRVSQGKTGAQDVITLTVVYPDGSIVTFSNGVITDAMFGKSISGAGRLKTRSYAFSFESNTGV